MSQYRLERYGDPDKWGAFQIVDVDIGSNKPVAVVNDPDMAQRIVDLLNVDAADKARPKNRLLTREEFARETLK